MRLSLKVGELDGDFLFATVGVPFCPRQISEDVGTGGRERGLRSGVVVGVDVQIIKIR